MLRRHTIRVLFLVLFGMALTGCATAPPFSSQPPFTPQTFNLASYQAKVDNVFVILDASASMRTWYGGSNRLAVAKEVVSRMNQTMPDMDLQGALRTFGHSLSVSAEDTALMYGPAAYSKTGMQAGLDKVTGADGSSPMEQAIDAANADLRGTSGKSALIILSDGEDMGKGPLAAATRLKEQYGDRLCIYTIYVGSTPDQVLFMRQLAQTSECGYATDADKLATSTAMHAFVEDVFLSKRMDDDHDGVYNDLDNCPDTPQGVNVDQNGCALDSDKDGVADNRDNCPDTPQGVSVDQSGCALDSDKDGVADNRDNCPDTPQGVNVDQNGCALDSDGDGVADYRDNCPDTPPGKSVDTQGCPESLATQSGAKMTESGTWLIEDIKFDTSSANIKSGSYAVMAEIAAVLKQNPDLKVEVQGHTDSAGSLALNNTLSVDRANAVRDSLIDQGVDPNQLTAEGYGPSRPLVTNDTAQGRASNRRVELKPLQ